MTNCYFCYRTVNLDEVTIRDDCIFELGVQRLANYYIMTDGS